MAWLWAIYQEPMFWLLVVGGNLIGMAAFLTFAGPMTWLAVRDPERLRPYRIQQGRRPRRPKVIQESIRSWLLNNALMFALSAALWPLLRLTDIHWGPLPPWYVIVLQVVFFIYLDDALYYIMHRSMHRSRWLFKHVHSVHHRVRTPWAITGHYMHPAEYVATGTLMLVGPALVGCHVGVLWLWIVIRQWEAAEGHCGYDLPWSPTHLLPGGDGARHHDFHHAKVRGNYAGFLAWLDGLLGTYVRGYPDEGSSRYRDPDAD